MFLGVYECKIDNKNRIFIPANFRKSLKEIVLTYIDKDTLVIRSSEGWTPESVLSSSKVSDDKLDSYKNYIVYNSRVIKLDSQGRIVIPLDIIKRLSFSTDSFIIGKMDSFVIMNRLKYLQEIEELDRDWDEFLESSEGKEYKSSLILKRK